MRIKTSWPDRLLAVTLVGISCGLAVWLVDDNGLLVDVLVLVVVAALFLIYDFDYLHPSVAYVLPWITVIAFSMIPISAYARPLARSTYALVLSVMIIWLAFTVGAPVIGPTGRRRRDVHDRSLPSFRNIHGLALGFLVLYLFAAVSVTVSGYIPLLQAIATGDSGYSDFGIQSAQGFFYAFGNALGCMALYVYLRTREKKYLFFFLSLIPIYVMFVARGHILSLLVEAFVVRSFTTVPVGRMRLALYFLIGLFALNVLGEVRSGDVREHIRVEDDYKSIPAAAAWLYAYSYFNVLNLENTIAASDAPYFDGSMWEPLLPSILRPESVHPPVLDLPAMNVSSYIYPIYLDIGPIGVLAFTALAGAATAASYRRAMINRRFGDIATYACLFYCATLSFFSHFWFFLPVVFQLVFFWIFERLFFYRVQHANAS
jgi:oligosaccharide repeat unit polymerase